MAAKSSTLLIGPHADQLAVFRFKDGQLCHLAGLSYLSDADSAIEQNGWFAIIIRNGRRVSIGQFKDTVGVEHHGSFEMPPKTHAHCVAIKDTTLYIGGEGIGGETLIGKINLDTDQYALVPMEKPKKVNRRKAIDELLLDGDRLVAVDNLVFPKWLWEYDVADPNSPQILRSAMLPKNGANERIVGAAIGRTRIAVNSWTVGRFGSGTHLAIYSRNTFKRLQSINWGPSYSRGRSVQHDASDAPPWVGRLAFLGTDLFFAAGTKGIGRLDRKGELEYLGSKDREYVWICCVQNKIIAASRPITDGQSDITMEVLAWP
jgi:hypothetical protein